MQRPKHWDEALDLLVQLVQENRSLAGVAHRTLSSDRAKAERTLTFIRLDAIETSTAPFSPKESFAKTLAVDLLLSAIPFSKLLSFATIRSMGLASYLVRVSGEAPISRAAAARVGNFEWDVRTAAAKVRIFLMDPLEGGSQLARDAGKNITDTAFRSVAKEAIAAVDSGGGAEPTGLLGVEYFTQIQTRIDEFATLSDKSLDAILDLEKRLRRDFDRDSERALAGLVPALIAPALVHGPDRTARDTMERALFAFRSYRDSPHQLRFLPSIPLEREIKADLKDVVVAVNAKGLTFPAKLVAVTLALIYEFHKVVLVTNTYYTVPPSMGGIPRFVPQAQDKYLDVDARMWKAIFQALGGRADVNDARTKRLAKALGKIRETIIRSAS